MQEIHYLPADPTGQFLATPTDARRGAQAGETAVLQWVQDRIKQAALDFAQGAGQ